MAGFRRGGSALIVVAWALAACGGGAPPNDVAPGVGFGDVTAFDARRGTLPMAAPPVTGPPGLAATAPAPQAAPAQDVATRAAAAIASAEAEPPPEAPPVTLASAPLPDRTAASPGISDEQDFDAVADRETIESDAARLARMQAERVVVAPTAVPDRPAGLGPNIIDYALSTTHPVGDRRYSRSPLGQGRHERTCLDFRSADLAQEWFLQNGGPGRDRRGLDPDGDGYACGWDPSVYRAAAAAARN